MTASATDFIEFDPADCFAPSEVLASSGWHYRDYQVRSFEAVDAAFAEVGRVLVVQATGTGKTVLFTYLANQVVRAGGRVLIIAHSEELLDQAADKLLRSTGLVAALEKADEHASLHEGVVLASVQTLARDSRLNGWPADHFNLVIVDECHRAMAKSYRKILAHFTGKVLGVTATADRGDKKSLAEIFERCAFEFNLLEAVREGWLVRPVVKTMPLTIDLKGVKTSRTQQGSDYDLTEVAHRIEPFISEIARLMAVEVVGRGQGIVFLPSVATAGMMAAALREHGVGAAMVSGECEDRAEKIAAFKAGELRAVCNAMLLIEGFDHDAVDWICVLRPTKIRSLYVQAAGRGTRMLNGIVAAVNASSDAKTRRRLIAESAKPTLLILDFLWLTEKLDLIAPVHLVAKNEEVAKQMLKEPKDGDLIEMEAGAERDLLAALEKAVKANRTKKSRVIDPLAFAVSIHADDLATYEPKDRWEFRPPSPEQIKLLENNGLNAATVATAGMASRLIDKVVSRARLGLCTPKQMTFLERLGYKDASMMTREAAGAIITQQMVDWRNKRGSIPVVTAQSEFTHA